MKKYAQGEGKLEVFRGQEAQVVNDHMHRLGKAVSDFDKRELSALNADLDAVRSQDETPSSADNKDPVASVDFDSEGNFLLRKDRDTDEDGPNTHSASEDEPDTKEGNS